MNAAMRKTDIRVFINPTNPGQFFACCGLLELAARLWPDSEGWFEDGEFCICAGQQEVSLEQLLRMVLAVEMDVEEPDKPTISPLTLAAPFNLRLDWWRDERSGGSTFKTWAGQQKVVGIAKAMHRALARAIPLGPKLLQLAEVLPDPDEPKKSVAPFYFDARRAAGAESRHRVFYRRSENRRSVVPGRGVPLPCRPSTVSCWRRGRPNISLLRLGPENALIAADCGGRRLWCIADSRIAMLRVPIAVSQQVSEGFSSCNSYRGDE